MPSNFELNLDINKIIKNQKDYHLLNLNYIKDNKIKALNYVMFFNEIYKARDKCKYPILLVIEEVGNLAPFNAKGYQEYLVDYFRDKLKIFRIKGSFILNNQVWHDIDTQIRSYSPDIFFGRIEMSDMSRLKKVYLYDKDTVNALSRLRVGHFVMKDMEQETIEGIRCFLPRHCHAEEGYRFIDFYRKEYPDLLTSYSDVVKRMKEFRKQEEEDIRKLERLDRKTQKENYDKLIRQKEKQKEIKEELKTIKEKQRQENIGSKEELKLKCYEEFKSGSSIRTIAKKYNKTHPTISNWLNEMKENQKEEVVD